MNTKELSLLNKEGHSSRINMLKYIAKEMDLKPLIKYHKNNKNIKIHEVIYWYLYCGYFLKLFRTMRKYVEEPIYSDQNKNTNNVDYSFKKFGFEIMMNPQLFVYWLNVFYVFEKKGNEEKLVLKNFDFDLRTKLVIIIDKLETHQKYLKNINFKKGKREKKEIFDILKLCDYFTFKYIFYCFKCEIKNKEQIDKLEDNEELIFLDDKKGKLNRNKLIKMRKKYPEEFLNVYMRFLSKIDFKSANLKYFKLRKKKIIQKIENIINETRENDYKLLFLFPIDFEWKVTDYVDLIEDNNIFCDNVQNLYKKYCSFIDCSTDEKEIYNLIYNFGEKNIENLYTLLYLYPPKNSIILNIRYSDNLPKNGLGIDLVAKKLKNKEDVIILLSLIGGNVSYEYILKLYDRLLKEKNIKNEYDEEDIEFIMLNIIEFTERMKKIPKYEKLYVLIETSKNKTLSNEVLEKIKMII